MRLLKESGVATEPGQEAWLQGRADLWENAPSLSGLCPQETVNLKNHDYNYACVLADSPLPSVVSCVIFLKCDFFVFVFVFRTQCGERRSQKGITR